MQKLKRAAYVIVAAVVATVSLLSGWTVEHVNAAQVTSRSIKISSSVASATNVAYQVSFTIQTTGNVGGAVIDFCENTPIIGDACDNTSNSFLTGFSLNPTTSSLNGQTGITDFAIDTTNSTASKLILTRTAASVTAPLAVSFTLGNGTTDGVTNPSDIGGNPTGSFYARIYTYATTAAAQGHNTNTPTGYVDYGGIALALATVINITARVMEQLSFCVYKTACGDDPSFVIGHTVGTTTIIDDSAVDTQTANFSISTNANSGAVIRMKGDTLKDPQANDINAAGNSAITFVAGTENFGIRISTAGTNVTPTAPYNGGSGTQYALMTTGGGSSDITSTYGGQIADLTLPTNNSISTITFAATASVTTAAGTYTATQQLIATGTF